MMKNIVLVTLYVLLGAAAFWTPDILLHTRHYEGAIVRTFLLPGTLLIVYLSLLRFNRHEIKHPAIALFMVLGVWLLGPTAMLISSRFYGGGYSSSQDLWIAILMGIVPFYTFIMATYDASLLGLLIASIIMILTYFRFEREHWFIPPAVRAWLIRGFQSE